MGTNEKRVGNMIYMIKGPQFTHKRHLNQIRKRPSDYADNGPPEEREVMDVIYDTFHLPIPQAAPERRRLKRKRKMTDFIVVNQREKRIETSAEFILRSGVLWKFTHARMNSPSYKY